MMSSLGRLGPIDRGRGRESGGTSPSDKGANWSGQERSLGREQIQVMNG